MRLCHAAAPAAGDAEGLFDRVLVHGAVYRSDDRFEQGRPSEVEACSRKAEDGRVAKLPVYSPYCRHRKGREPE